MTISNTFNDLSKLSPYQMTEALWQEMMENKECDIPKAIYLINNGAEINDRGRNGDTPLTFVATIGLAEVAVALINKGADLNKKSANGHTPLMRAAYYFKNDRDEKGLVSGKIVAALLAKGADIDALSNSGHTALSNAEEKGATKIIQMIKDESARRSAILKSDPRFNP